jgi:hypothetical protein
MSTYLLGLKIKIENVSTSNHQEIYNFLIAIVQDCSTGLSWEKTTRFDTVVILKKIYHLGIRLPNTDPDPGGIFNANTCGS